MIRIEGFSTIVLTVLVGAGVSVDAAAQRPDFSGEWALAPVAAPARAGAPAGRSAPPVGDMGSGWGSPLTIVQEGNLLTVQYSFFVRGDLQPPLKFTFAFDGSETHNVVSMGRGVQEQRSRTAWQGDVLVITTLHAFTDPRTGTASTAEVRQALSLETPHRLIVEATRVGVLGGPTNTTRTAYLKP